MNMSEFERKLDLFIFWLMAVVVGTASLHKDLFIVSCAIAMSILKFISINKSFIPKKPQDNLTPRPYKETFAKAQFLYGLNNKVMKKYHKIAIGLIPQKELREFGNRLWFANGLMWALGYNTFSKGLEQKIKKGETGDKTNSRGKK